MSVIPKAQSWTHGGHPWSFWQKSGQFLYVFGEAFPDDAAPPNYVRTPLKVGITKDPKGRLSQLRQKTPHGIWYQIQWMENGAHLTERALHELFNPWRCGFAKEYFRLPLEVEDWLFQGMSDAWRCVARHDRLGGTTVREICTYIMPAAYPARWLSKRLKAMDAVWN